MLMARYAVFKCENEARVSGLGFRESALRTRLASKGSYMELGSKKGFARRQLAGEQHAFPCLN